MVGQKVDIVELGSGKMDGKWEDGWEAGRRMGSGKWDGWVAGDNTLLVPPFQYRKHRTLLVELVGQKADTVEAGSTKMDGKREGGWEAGIGTL